MERDIALGIVESLVISGLPVHPKARDRLRTAIGELNPEEAARIDSAAQFRDLAESHRRALEKQTMEAMNEGLAGG